jgi:predicted nucleic acid-binding protein
VNDRVFLDTNVVLYADDRSAGVKRARALNLLRELAEQGRAVVSTQVLQEYFVVATRKLRVPADVARRKVEALAELDVVLIRPELVLAAVDLHRLHGLSFWDALIVRCASAAGCSRVMSEDMKHGGLFDGVRIENPFLDPVSTP